MPAPPRLDRRRLIGLAGLGALGMTGAVSGCSTDDPAPAEGGSAMASERFRYGDDPAQWVDLYRPEGKPTGVVVVIHGGFWKSQYDATLGAPLAADLADRGWAAWNVEYRRVGNGGGWPQTFDDVSAAIDLLAEVPDLELSTVVTLGHSAGGHLGAWAAARNRFDRWRGATVPVTAVVAQAGVLDLTTAAEQGLGSGAVEALLGSPPGPSYDEVDPQRQIPLAVPVWCVHGDQDGIVPLTQSTGYVEAATAAGAPATLVEVTGDHFTLIDVTSPAWLKTVAVIDGL